MSPESVFTEVWHPLTIENQNKDPAGVGARIGHWLGCLHLAGTSCTGWKTQNDDIDKFVAPGGLEEQAIRAGMSKDGSSGETIEHALRVLREPPHIRTLTPWDFRPMNILVNIKESEAIPRMTIVDWEFTHYGDPAYGK